MGENLNCAPAELQLLRASLRRNKSNYEHVAPKRHNTHSLLSLVASFHLLLL